MIRDTIPKHLSKHRLTEKIVYETAKIVKKYPPLNKDGMVYFQAPSSVTDYVAAFSEPPKRIGSIGPTTANAIKKQGWVIDFQPSRPENHFFVEEIFFSSELEPH